MEPAKPTEPAEPVFVFNRVLPKLPKEEIARRVKKYVRRVEEIDVEPVCYPESRVLKVFKRHINPDDKWPVIELLNVVARDRDGKYANLLFSARDGKKFLVTGQIHVEEDLKDCLMTFRKKAYKNLNDSFIQLDNLDNVSMGWDPITMWISSNAGWFEVKPADEYRPMYEKMLHVISLFFLAIEDFEDRVDGGETYQVTDVPFDVDRVFEKYMLIDGSGATRTELVTACQDSREYLLDQFRKKTRNEYWVGRKPGIVWTESNFYRWVVGGCPTNPPGQLEPDPEMLNISPQPGNHITPLFKQHAKPKSPSPKKTCTPQPTNPTKQPTQSSNGLSQIGRPYHGEYNSPERPHGILPTDDNVGIIVAIACHAKAISRIKDLNIKNLSLFFYWDFSCDTNRAAKAVVAYYSNKVATRLVELNQSWKDTELYKGLVDAEIDMTAFCDRDKKSYKKLTTGGERAVHRRKKEAKGQPAQAGNTAAASAPHNIPPNMNQVPSAETPPSGSDSNANSVVNRPARSRKRKFSRSPTLEPELNAEQSSRGVEESHLGTDESHVGATKAGELPPPSTTDSELPPEKRHRDPKIISHSPNSRPPSPDRPPRPTHDSLGRPFPQRIKRAPGYEWI